MHPGEVRGSQLSKDLSRLLNSVWVTGAHAEQQYVCIGPFANSNVMRVYTLGFIAKRHEFHLSLGCNVTANTKVNFSLLSLFHTTF